MAMLSTMTGEHHVAMRWFKRGLVVPLSLSIPKADSMPTVQMASTRYR